MHLPSCSSTVEVPERAKITLQSPNEASLRIQDPQGQCQLRIDWKGGRPQVHLQQSDLLLDCVGELALHCDRFRLSADEEMILESQGSVELRGEEVTVRALLGDLLLSANDYLRALGEKILLNTEQDPERSEQSRQALVQRLLGYRARESRE